MHTFPPHLIYIPGAKYDTVKELSNGSIRIDPMQKQFYMHLALMQDSLLVFNAITGCVLKFDSGLVSSIILNAEKANLFVNCKGFCFHEQQFIFIANHGSSLIIVDDSFDFVNEVPLDFVANSISSGAGSLWLSDSQQSQIRKGLLQSGGFVHQSSLSFFFAGNASTCFCHEKLWVTDSEENIIRVIDPFSAELVFSILTPYPDPQSLIFYHEQCLVLYGGEMSQTSYENRCWQEQKPFLHALKYQVHFAEGYNYSLSNPMLLEFTIEEKIKKGFCFNNDSFDVLLSAPLNSVRQQTLEIRPIGFAIQDQGIQRSGMIKFSMVDFGKNAAGFIGYKAVLKLASCRYTLSPNIRQHLNEDELSQLKPFMIHQSELDSDRFEMQQMANQIPDGTFADMAIAARDLVYSKLHYQPNDRARDFIELLDQAYGTCGDYTCILMALLINKGIPVRSVGGYKVPRFTNAQGENMSNYYNHSWLEFYQPAVGWLPLESSSDQRGLFGRFSRAQWMGEDWTHIRTHIGKNVPDHIDIVDANIHPYDVFENITYMKIIGEIDF